MAQALSHTAARSQRDAGVPACRKAPLPWAGPHLASSQRVGSHRSCGVWGCPREQHRRERAHHGGPTHRPNEGFAEKVKSLQPSQEILQERNPKDTRILHKSEVLSRGAGVRRVDTPSSARCGRRSPFGADPEASVPVRREPVSPTFFPGLPREAAGSDTHTCCHAHRHSHACIHANTRTYTRIHTHTRTHAHMHTRTRINTRVYTCTHEHTHSHMHTHVHMHVHVRAQICTHRHTHVQACARTYTQVRAHACAHAARGSPRAQARSSEVGAAPRTPVLRADRGSHRGAGKSHEKRGAVAFGEGGWVTPSASKVNARRNETRVFQVGLQTATGTGTLRFTLLRDLRRCGLSAYQRCDGGVGIRGAGSFLSVWGRSNKNEGRCSGGTAHRERRRAAQTRGPRAPRPAGGTWRLSGCERVRIN